ncbi:glutamate racemase [Pantoea agglomerans]|nr:glutamate racemase [Pantoea agglomerans]
MMPALLAEAERSGGMTTALRRRIAQMIETLLPQFDAVLITCSTLGPVAGDFSAQDRVMRTDGMLAEALQRQAGRTVALCAAESTLAVTRALFCQPGSQVEVALVEGAWTAFKAGGDNTLFCIDCSSSRAGLSAGSRCGGPGAKLNDARSTAVS